VANYNAIRLLSLGLMVALSASASSAQQTSTAVASATEGAGLSSTIAPPATLAEKAPRAPRVTCDGDQLTISADNSTLGSVLAAVHACIGVQIDIPEGATSSRTFGELGPGPQRQVLESLLSGTDYNYVIGSSDANPQKIESVLLMLRTTEAANTSVSTEHTLTPGRRAWLLDRPDRAASLAVESHPAQDETPATPAPPSEDAVTEPADNAGANGAQVPASDTPPPAPDPPSAPSVTTAPTTSISETPSATPSFDSSQGTTEKINDMQQLFQQRRQMTQSQNSTSTPQQ